MSMGMEKILAGIILVGLSAVVCAASEEVEDELELLTDVHGSIEAAGVSGGEYRLRTGRELQFDILKYDKWFVHFGIEEISIYDYSPSQLDHTIQYVSGGYETENGRVSLFWEHTCNNPSRELPGTERNDIRWNEIGIGYETAGKRIGHENDGINFDVSCEWLNRINWGVSFSRVWMRNENDYDYMLRVGLRDDVVRIGNHIFYAQFMLNTINSERGTNPDPAIEVGDRIRLGKNVCLVPFVSYEHFHDWYGLGDGEDFFLAGARLEASLGGEKSKDSLQEVVISSEEQPIRFHIEGGYSVNLHGTKKKSRSSDFTIDLDIMKFDDNKVLAVNTYAGILTEPGAFDVQNVNYKVGPSLKIDLNDYYLRFFHSYSCLYGEDYDGVIRNYNLVGAETGSEETLSWSVQGAVYPSTTNFDYDGFVQGMMGYDFYSTEWISPYIKGYLNYLCGDDSVFGNAFEAGLKFRGEAGGFVLYLRLEDSFDVFRFGEGKQRWLGFRFEF